MAGGVGSRLWPVSVPQKPKQFMDLLGIGKTLIQLTVDRFLPVCNLKDFWVVTSEAYVKTVKEQLPGIPESHILAEPVARNTAPCIAYACWKISAKEPDSNIVVTPADALILNEQKFSNIIRKALNFTAKGNGIVTVGIRPTRPATGYGYIKIDAEAEEDIVKVQEFEEKPDEATAKKYLESGNYLWNAGIFVWNARTIIREIRAYAPQIAGIMDEMSKAFGTWREKDVTNALFPKCEKISIDYAVMEKSSEVYTIPCNLGWSDLGSFVSVKEHIPEQEDKPGSEKTGTVSAPGGNKSIGKDVRFFGCEGCIVHAEGAKKVVVKGLRDYIVAVNDGNVLVCPLEDEQHIKEYSK